LLSYIDSVIMFEPPKHTIHQADLKNLFQKLETTKLLDLEELSRFLKLKPDFIGSIDLAELFFQKAKLYLNQITGSNVIPFLHAYMLTIKGNPTKQIIFLVMHFVAQQHYTEMMAFQKYITNDDILEIYSSLMANIKQY
jgi:hypothetical protein